MDTLSYKTKSANAQSVDKKWVLVDAEGQVLGRVATQIATLLRGKHKPYYTPHVDCGDNVVVINADKIRLTGNKMQQKNYIRHTTYPGGQRVVNASDMFKNNPDRMVEKAVKGMLPKNRLGRALYRNLRVYAGAEHQHEAQQPEKFELK
jgi:large subunit ribosomal protein L13